MKDWKTWGIRIRKFPTHNYNAVFYNLKTIRLGTGVAEELPPDLSEFYDIGINSKCNAECPFCYVSANKHGVNNVGICDSWESFMKQYESVERNGFIFTNKPFQIAIGSTGEPTIHPDFCRFLETVYNTEVIPNYTTNGLVIAKSCGISSKILEYTKNYVGGVAVSFGNPDLRAEANVAVIKLLQFGDTNVNIHHIISDRKSVDDFVDAHIRYGHDIYYHVLLPLMPSGRSMVGMENGVFEYLEEKIQKFNITNAAFGAHFVEQLKHSKIPTYIYPPESLSKNIIISSNKIQITPSSFDLNPIKVLKFNE